MSLYDIAEAILERGNPIPVDLWANLVADGYDLSNLTNPHQEEYE